MGRVVVAKGGLATYGGQRIQFCCPPCQAKFEQDPERSMRLMRADPLAYAYDRPGPTSAQMRVARTNQGTANGKCPVRGRLVTADGGTVDYRGERIGFCSAECVATFQAAPETYMTRMRSERAAYGYVPSTR
jgi:YHS domain-containing protein